MLTDALPSLHWPGASLVPLGIICGSCAQAVLGVLSKPGYLGVGGPDPKHAEVYEKKPELRSSLKGKQFKASPAKSGTHGMKLPNVYLERKHTYMNHKEPYTDRVSYNDKAKEEESKGVPRRSRRYAKKRGFWISDFPRRDEFTFNVTTQQYRERLSQERKHTNHASLDDETLRRMREDAGADSSDSKPSTTASPRKVRFLHLVM